MLQTPWILPGRLPVFIQWNIAVISLALFFFCFNILDQIFYFCTSKFPEDFNFLNICKEADNKKSARRLIAILQWIIICFILLCYFSYIGTVVVWLILGAIINPDNFLVYASASLTFVTFIVSKYTFFKEIFRDGTKAIERLVYQFLITQVLK